MSGLRERGFVLRHPLAVGSQPQGEGEAEISIFGVASGKHEPPHTLVIARRREKPEAQPERNAVLESCADAILAVDRAGFVTYANPGTRSSPWPRRSPGSSPVS
jgi:hypothetical protein